MAMIPGKSLLPRLFEEYTELGVRVIRRNDVDTYAGLEPVFGSLTETPFFNWKKGIDNRFRGTILYYFTFRIPKPRKITFRTNKQFINQRRYNGHKKPNK